jgi:hypothetical protein
MSTYPYPRICANLQTWPRFAGDKVNTSDKIISFHGFLAIKTYAASPRGCRIRATGEKKGGASLPRLIAAARALGLLFHFWRQIVSRPAVER